MRYSLFLLFVTLSAIGARPAAAEAKIASMTASTLKPSTTSGVPCSRRAMHAAKKASSASNGFIGSKRYSIAVPARLS